MRNKTLVAVIVVCAIVVSAVVINTVGLPFTGSSRVLSVPYVQQFNPLACLAACAEMVYKYYGLNNVTQQQLFSLYGTYPNATSGAQGGLYTANITADAQTRGFNAYTATFNLAYPNAVQWSIYNLVQSGVPVIVLQRYADWSYGGHGRVIRAINATGFLINDPDNSALIFLNTTTFFALWKSDDTMLFPTGGIYVVIQRK
jgi:ABC-type bacteriocin/lantibiotic exporter with double-glycine peptidase domain